MPYLMACSIGLTIASAGCSAGDSLQPNQVIVPLDGIPSDVNEARPIAEAQCVRRGGHARFVTVVDNALGEHGADNPEPPAAVFACDPAR
jgi:hypothetical protein